MSDTTHRGANPLSVVDQVAAQILSMILSNELIAGDPIAIQGLSQRLGVSHVPVREALRRLEGRGLVEFRRGRRPTISTVSRADLDGMFHLREIIETDAARRSVELVTADTRRQWERDIADLHTALQGGDAGAIYTAHSRLHLDLLPGATTWDRRVLEQLWTASERYIQRYMGVRPGPAAIATIIDLHRELIDAASDPHQLVEAVAQHLRDSHERLAETVESAG